MTFRNFSLRPGHPPLGVGKSLPSSAFRAELHTKTSVGDSSTLQVSLGGLSELKVSNLGELMPSHSKGLGSKYLQVTPTRWVLSSSHGSLAACSGGTVRVGKQGMSHSTSPGRVQYLVRGH